MEFDFEGNEEWMNKKTRLAVKWFFKQTKNSSSYLRER